MKVEKIQTNLHRMREPIRSRHVREFMDAYIALMIGEVELGDPGNHYLYVQHTHLLAQKVLKKFIRDVEQLGHTTVSSTIGDTEVVLVNGTHYFHFAGMNRVATLMAPDSTQKFCRVFFDVCTKRTFSDPSLNFVVSLMSSIDESGDVI